MDPRARRRLRIAVAAVVGLPLLLAGLALGWGGLLLEPIDMRVLGPCPGRGDADCARVRCVVKNQGPLRSRGGLTVDAWAGPGYETGTFRHQVPLDLRAGEELEIVEDFPGVPWIPGTTMVRCMPWYAAGRWRPAELRPDGGGGG